MNALWPTVAEERAMALADRVEEWRKDGLLPPPSTSVAADFSSPSAGNGGLESAATSVETLDAALAVPWKSNSNVVSAVFFVLTCLTVGFTYFLFDLLHIPGGFVTLIAIAAAEGLIVGKKCFGTGVESALWIGGLVAFIFSLPSSGKPEALLVFVAAFVIAGVRMRNALFVTIATVLVIAYFGVKNWPEAAMVAGIGAGLVALLAGVREWLRPWIDLLWAVLAVVLPVAGVVTGAIAGGTPAASWALVCAALAVAAFRVGVATRQHAALFAGFVDLCVASGIIAANDLLPWSVETRAIVAGILMLAISIAISRALRGRERGLTATQTRLEEMEELSQLAGAMHVQHSTEPAAAAQPAGGGEFGGAGATGDY